MPRKPRFELPGVPQHVIQRGNNRKPCFYAEADYRRYLDDLRNAAEKYEQEKGKQEKGTAGKDEKGTEGIKIHQPPIAFDPRTVLRC